MEYLIWAGAVVSLLGVAGILASVLTSSRARRAGLDDAGLRAKLRRALQILIAEPRGEQFFRRPGPHNRRRHSR